MLKENNRFKMRMNLSQQLKNYFDEKQLFVVKKISERAKKFNIKAYIVGGVVRDLLLEKQVYDLDIVVEGNAIEFCRYLEKNEECRIKRISEDFGTSKIIIGESIEVDVASTRIESYPKPGHLPKIEKIGCSLKDDICRRDFSVNALVLSINVESFGDLIDFTNGLEDLKKKQLRILHENSFIDDPTRIIRALRFEYKLNFEIEPNTKKLMQQYLDKFAENDICYERIKQVLKLAFELNSSEIFDKIIDNKIFKLVTKKVETIKGREIYNQIEINKNHIDEKNIWLIYLICLCNLQDVEKLNLNAKELDIASDLYKLKEYSCDFETDYEIYCHYKPYSTESIVAYIAITKSSQAQKYLDKLKDLSLCIDGNTLLKMGFARGEKIGEVLKLLLKDKINGNIVTENDEIKLAKKIMLES